MTTPLTPYPAPGVLVHDADLPHQQFPPPPSSMMLIRLVSNLPILGTNFPTLNRGQPQTTCAAYTVLRSYPLV